MEQRQRGAQLLEGNKDSEVCLGTKTQQKTLNKVENPKTKNRLAKSKLAQRRRGNKDNRTPDRNRRAKTILPSRGHQEQTEPGSEWRKGKESNGKRRESKKREGRARGLIAVFPIQGIREGRVSKERIAGGMGGGMRSKKKGEGAGIQPGTRRGEEGVETRSGKWMGSRVGREASGGGTRRSKWVG